MNPKGWPSNLPKAPTCEDCYQVVSLAWLETPRFTDHGPQCIKCAEVCGCRRCVPSGDSAEDYCYAIAYEIDENGNYRDDEGNDRNGQTGEIIEEVVA
mgnify:FL=1